MKPLVLITAPPPTRMPFGLIRKTRPFASSCPSMLDGLPETTRFNIADDALGCMKRVSSDTPIEKFCQFTIARSVACLTMSVFALRWKVALPAITFSPTGLAKRGFEEPQISASKADRGVRLKRMRFLVNYGRITEDWEDRSKHNIVTPLPRNWSSSHETAEQAIVIAPTSRKAPRTLEAVPACPVTD